MLKAVTAFNGVRDKYTVPVALAQSGLLHKHVSDFYLPDRLAPLAKRFAPGPSARHNTLLPSRHVSMSPAAVYLNARQRFNKHPEQGADPYFEIDRALSLHAGEIAARSKCNLFLHSNYAYWAFKDSPDIFKLIFQYHPHPALCNKLLEQDSQRFPEIANSFASERDSQPLESFASERLDEWKYADHAICASSFTKRSLTFAGMDEAKISVLPYDPSAAGLEHSSLADFESRRTDQKKVRFVFVGQGVQRKGLHHLLLAWLKLGHGKYADLTLVCRRIDPGLLPLVARSGATLIRGLSGAELKHLYQVSDVFVMPSLVEGFGLVYLEAIAHGLICIGTTNTGLPDLISDPSAKVYSIAGDIDSLQSAILTATDRITGRQVCRTTLRNSVFAGKNYSYSKSLVDCYAKASLGTKSILPEI